MIKSDTHMLILRNYVSSHLKHAHSHLCAQALILNERVEC